MQSTTNDLSAIIREAVLKTLAEVPALKPYPLAYTFDAAAEATGISRRAIADAHSRGEFRAKKVCSRWMVTRDELLRWLEAR